MPRIYLSPSAQEGNFYLSGGSEEYHMNLLADAMEPYLRSSGIEFTRNSPDMTVPQIIAQSNSGNYDFHLALHSNASPEDMAGELRGPSIYYYPTSSQGLRMAEIMARNLASIYPLPELIQTIPTTTLAEVRRTVAPAVLLEVAYHDNPEDEAWIINNTDAIAQNIVLSLTEYFDIPFVWPQPVRTGVVTLTSGNLNIRKKPNTWSQILTTAPNGAELTVLGEWNNWYVVNYNGVTGYAYAPYITVS